MSGEPNNAERGVRAAAEEGAELAASGAGTKVSTRWSSSFKSMPSVDSGDEEGSSRPEFDCAVTKDAELNLEDTANEITVALGIDGTWPIIAGDDFMRRRLLRVLLLLRRTPAGKKRDELRGETSARGGSW